MSAAFDRCYYAITLDGYVRIDDNEHDYSNDQHVIELMKKYKKLALGDAINQPIDFLPDGITHLHLDKSFNQPIMNLPQSLKELSIYSAFGTAFCDFNQSLDYLPEGLESFTMKLARNFNFPIDNFPISLKHLHFTSTTFTHPINNLPDGLETLVIKTFDFANTHKLPSSLRKMNINCVLLYNAHEILKRNLVDKYPNIEFDI